MDSDEERDVKRRGATEPLPTLPFTACLGCELYFSCSKIITVGWLPGSACRPYYRACDRRF